MCIAGYFLNVSFTFATHTVPLNLFCTREVLRDRSFRPLQFLLRLSEQIGDARANTGLCRHQINMLPLRVHGGLQAGRDVACNICMCDYETGDNLRMLPCFHEFHQACIDQWIQVSICPSSSASFPTFMWGRWSVRVASI